jgi:hypothetical protein
MLKRLIAPLVLAFSIAACTTPTTTVLQVTNLVPADGATGVAVDVVLSATFNLGIDVDTLDGSFVLETEGGDEVAGVIDYDAATRTATFTPDEDLAFETTYTATVSGDVATETGVQLAGEASWSFTTADAPTPVGLDVTGVQPVNGSVGVEPDATVSATFNLDIDPATLTDNFGLATQGGSAVTGAVTYDAASRTATFTPAAPLAFATTYVATLDASVATGDGAALPADVTWSFATRSEVVIDPLVLSLDDTTGFVDLDGTLYVTEGDAFGFAVSAVGGVEPYTFATSAFTGTVESDGSYSVAGTAGTPGPVSVTVTVTDDVGTTDTVVVAFTVAAPLEVSYAPYAAGADVFTAIEIDPTVTGAVGDVTFTRGNFVDEEFVEATTNDVVPAFTTLERDAGLVVIGDRETYNVVFGSDGSITGSTGFPGEFTGVVRVEDELGRVAFGTYELDLDLVISYTGDTTEYAPAAIVEGFIVGVRVLVSGVETEWLPETDMDLVFVLERADPPGNGGNGFFDINTADGTISKVALGGTGTWNYEIVATHVDSGKVSEPFAFTFIAAVAPGLTNTDVGTGSTRTSVTLARPAGVLPGDVLIAQVNYRTSGRTIAAPAGWTFITTNTSSNANGTLTQALYWREADATDGVATTYAWSINGGAVYMSVGLSSFRNVNTADVDGPIFGFNGVNPTSTGGSAISIGSIAGAPRGAGVLAVFTSDRNIGAVTGQIYNTTGNFTNRIVAGATAQTATGPTGTRGATVSEAGRPRIGQMIVLRPN